MMSRKNSGRQGFLRQLDSMLGLNSQRRKQQSAFSIPAELLETRQLLAADLSKVLYQAAILDTTAPDAQIGSYLVVFDAPKDAAAIKSATGASSVTPYAPIANSFDLVYDSPITLQTAADRIAGLSNFAYLSPNVDTAVELRMLPNDTYFPAQWYLRNTGQTNGVPGTDLNVTSVWDTYNGNGVTVAVVDDGVDVLHPDLLGNISGAGLDIVGGDSNPTPTVNAIHGTGVAGIIAAVGNNNQGITGTAFGANIAGIRLLDVSQGTGTATVAPVSSAATATALTHALDTISISNNSWGPKGTGDIAVLPVQVATALATGTTTGRGGTSAVKRPASPARVSV